MERVAPALHASELVKTYCLMDFLFEPLFIINIDWIYCVRTDGPMNDMTCDRATNHFGPNCEACSRGISAHLVNPIDINLEIEKSIAFHYSNNKCVYFWISINLEHVINVFN